MLRQKARPRPPDREQQKMPADFNTDYIYPQKGINEGRKTKQTENEGKKQERY